MPPLHQQATVIHRAAPPVSATAVVAAVLAGGRGSRMGGADKGLLTFGGSTLVDQVLERIRPQVGPVVINANRNLGSYRERGLPVVVDRSQDYQGPLAGMVAVMDEIEVPWYLFVPCDTPYLPADLLERLIEVQRHTGQPVICASDPSGMHPTLSLVSRTLLASLRHALLIGERRLQGVFSLLGLATAEWHDPLFFHNLNMPEQLEQPASCEARQQGQLHG